jgi:hypothetical protein
MSHNGNGQLLVEAQIDDRLPAYNSDLERYLLGGLLGDPSRMGRVLEIMSADDLYSEQHQVFFRVLVDLHGKGKRWDTAIFTDELIKRGVIKNAYSEPYLGKLVDLTFHAVNTEEHAARVRAYSERRALQEIFNEGARQCLDSRFTAGQIRDRVSGQLSAIGGKPSAGRSDLSILSLADFSVCLKDVKEEPVEWLAGQRLAVGKMHLTIGPGGVGKSTYVITKAAALTNGGTYPGGPKFIRAGKVAVLAAEDSAADTIKPRFVAAGGNPALLFVNRTRVTTKDKDGRTVILHAVFQNLDYWNRFFDAWNPAYLIADPIQAYMGRGVNDNRNAEVRDILEPFVELVRERGVAFEGITHTPKKIESRNAAELAINSVAYPNLSRVIHVHWTDPDNPEHYLVTNPKNWQGKKQPPIGYTISSHEYLVDGQVIRTSRLECDKDQPDVDERDLLNGHGRAPGRKSEIDLQEAAEWLRKRLQGGPASSLAVAAQGDAHFGKTAPDLSQKDATVKMMSRVKWWRERILKTALGGYVKKCGFNSGWFFCLNDSDWPPSQTEIEAASALAAVYPEY